MKTIAKMIGLSIVAGGAGCCGAMLTSLVFTMIGVKAGSIPFLVGGVWAGEFLNSVIWK